jgi:hypothetical protein
MAARKKANEDGTPKTGELSKKAGEDDTPRTEELPEYKPEKYGSLTDIDIDGAGNLYVVDQFYDMIRKIDPNEHMTEEQKQQYRPKPSRREAVFHIFLSQKLCKENCNKKCLNLTANQHSQNS